MYIVLNILVFDFMTKWEHFVSKRDLFNGFLTIIQRKICSNLDFYLKLVGTVNKLKNVLRIHLSHILSGYPFLKWWGIHIPHTLLFWIKLIFVPGRKHRLWHSKAIFVCLPIIFSYIQKDKLRLTAFYCLQSDNNNYYITILEHLKHFLLTWQFT